MDHSVSNGEEDGARRFDTTQWTLVLAAREKDTPEAAAALEELCRIYWPPVHAYIRRKNYGTESEAMDLTQEFFAQLIKKNYLARLRHQRGRFRSFLLTLLKHFLSDERDKARAFKRGGHYVTVPLGEGFARDEPGTVCPADERTPTDEFERRWAQTLLDLALARLREEYIATQRGELFERLNEFQPGLHREGGYRELGRQFGLTENGIKSAMHRFRQRFGQLLREEIGHTVATPVEIEDEIRYLMAVIARL